MIILIGESGSGKTTILKELEKRGYRAAINHTTREPRDEELEKGEYIFLSKDKFEEMWNANQLLERVEFGGEYYGISSDSLADDVVTIQIVETIPMIKQKIKELGKENVNLSVFYISVPSEERIQRMLKRGDSIDSIQKRIAIDKEKFTHVQDVIDYVVENDDLQRAVEDIIRLSKEEK